jgi:diguanylate cyclase (GGDEF)-like protein
MSWETERLTEFVVALSRFGTGELVAERGVERTAEALDAEVAALVRDGRVAASYGWPRIEVPEGALLEVAAAGEGALPVPGGPPCAALGVALDDGRDGVLLVARRDGAFDAAEVTLLRGLARGLAQSLQLLDVVENERALRVRSEQQALENTKLLKDLRERQLLLEALSSIQRSISHRAPLDGILDAIVATAAELLGDPAAALRLVGGENPPDGGVSARAVADNRLHVIEGAEAAMAAPVHEQGDVIGALCVRSREPQRTYSRAEQEILIALAENASLALTDAKTVGAMVHQALHDTLTGLPNRALFVDRLAHALNRRGAEVAVLFIDLDRFKAINDTLGHAAGDALLIAVAERIGRCLRGADTAARLGGDEFAVLLEDVQGMGDAIAVAQRIARAFGGAFSLDGHEVFCGCSIGIARGHGGGDELLRNADVAMYRAKADGNDWAVFEPSMRAEVIERLELEADLRKAEERGELEVHYQPLVALADGTLAGFEALIRWRHPQRGIVAPTAFIPVAEESGLIHALGRWVLNTACAQAAHWDRVCPTPAGMAPRWITVNLSGLELERPDLVDQVAAALDASGLAPERLVLEITETVLMHDTEATIERLATLKELGVRLAVDDFGTGYSSLRYLSRFPIDLLKMAKPFVDGVDQGERTVALAQTIIDLGRSLDLAIIAEGIELGAQLSRLRSMECEYGQGYLFARPLTVRQVDALLAQRGGPGGFKAGGALYSAGRA